MRFRWVVLQLAELEECSSRHEVNVQLAELPKGLDEIYNRILKNIKEKYRADTRTFLQWLAFCKRPMTIEEIAETITADLSGKCPVFNLDKRYTDPRDVLLRCSSFVSESKGKYGRLLLHFRF
jgi:heterodisulfide reductase subunit B